MMQVKNKGFTLVELMVTIAVLAIVLSIAVPSFRGVLIRSKYNAAVTELTRALEYTRQQALGTGTRGRFCLTEENSEQCLAVISHKLDSNTPDNPQHWVVQLSDAKQGGAWRTVRRGTLKLGAIDYIQATDRTTQSIIVFEPTGQLLFTPQTGKAWRPVRITLLPVEYYLDRKQTPPKLTKKITVYTSGRIEVETSDAKGPPGQGRK